MTPSLAIRNYALNSTILFFILASFSCNLSSFKEKQIPAFRIKKEATGEQILSQEPTALSISVIDTLILLNLRSGEIHVYGTSKLQFLGSLSIVKNNKPLSLTYAGQSAKDNTGINVWLSSITSNRLFFFNVTASLATHKCVISKEISLANKNLPDFDAAFYINNSKVIGINNIWKKTTNFDKRFFILDPVKKNIQLFSVPLVNSESLDMESVNIINHGTTLIKPDGAMIISAMHYSPKVDLYDIQGKHIISYLFDGKTKVTFSRADIREHNMIDYFETICVTNKLIYLLNTNQKDADVTVKNKDISINVIDWDGNPIEILNVKEHILGIAIDDKKDIMYGIDYPNHKIYRYKLR